jgi:exosortase E/protease (VPEID-CTERM system)
MAFPAWAALALLALEYCFLSATFDSTPLSCRPDGWAIAGQLAWLGVLAASGAIGAAVVVRADRPRCRELLLARRRLDAGALVTLAVHVASVASLWWLSARIFAPAGPPPGRPAGWLALWVLAAAAVSLSALATSLPSGRVRPLLKELGPPLALGAAIGGAAWVAGRASALLWWPVGPWTLQAVGRVLGLVLAAPVFDPSRALIGSEQFQVVVAPVCSGLEGIGLMTVFVGTYLLLARRQLRFPQALLLLPLGLAAAWVANVARLVLLVLFGTWVSEEVAAGGFHAKAGWLLFCGLALSLVLVVERRPFFARAPVGGGLGHPAAAYLLPLLTLVATSLLTGLLTRQLDLLYGVRILVAAAVLAAFRRLYRDITWSWSWTAFGAGLVAAAAFVALAPRPDTEALRAWQEEWQGIPGWGRISWLTLRVLGSVLVVPLAEELAFRGYLLRRLSARDFTDVPPGSFSVLGLVVSSVAFGAIHAGWLGGTIAGLFYGAVQIRGRSVGHAVLAHVVSNAAVALYVVGLGQWWLWV